MQMMKEKYGTTLIPEDDFGISNALSFGETDSAVLKFLMSV